MKRLALSLLGCLAAVASMLAVNCSGADPHPPPGIVDVGGDSGVDTGVSAADAGSSVEISPTEISLGDKGMVNCGTQAAPQTIALVNRTAKTRLFKAKLTSGGTYYTVSPDTVSVAAQGAGTMQLVPNALPAKSDVTPELYSGNVEITSEEVGGSGGAGATTIRVHQTARGATIRSTVDGKPIAFGGVKIGTTSNQTFSVTNTGNLAANVTFSLGGLPFTVTPTATLDPNGTKVQTVGFAPGGTQVYNDTLVTTIAPGTPVCDALPDSSAISGSGSTSVGVSPGNLAFGLVNCGSATAYKTLTISNAGAAMSFTPTLGKGAGSSYTLADNAGATVPLSSPTAVAASTDFVLRVVPKLVAPPVTTTVDGLSDTLTITTNSTGDTAHIIQLTETAQGAFIALDKSSYKVVDTLPVHVSLSDVKLTNTGNLSGNYTIAVTGRTGVPAGTFDFTGQVLTGSLAPLTGNRTTVLNTKTDAAWQCAVVPKSQWLGDIKLDVTAAALCSDQQLSAPVSLDCQ